MKLRLISLLYFTSCCHVLFSQIPDDDWIHTQLEKIVWQESYKGVLADYHPITLILASDHDQVAGYFVHEGDDRKHRLIGDWGTAGQFQLQERDQFDRLTGYLTGSVTSDQANLQWHSADQSRIFEVKAFPERLIKIKRFNPVAEWIQLAETSMFLSIQKMDYGVVVGVAFLNGRFRRFEGQCLDGTCSIWNAVISSEQGPAYTIQMRQKDAATYKAIVDGTEYKADIKFSAPLSLQQFDNSVGFLDFVYPQLDSKSYEAWMAARVDSAWQQGVQKLSHENDKESPGRLKFRSSGWIEIIDEGPSYMTGIITFIQPDVILRESFVWLKKEDAFLVQTELLNKTDDVHKASSSALASTAAQDEIFLTWLQEVGYTLVLPTSEGVVMSTAFSMIYGDDLQMLSGAESQALIKKKYWKYFGW